MLAYDLICCVCCVLDGIDDSGKEGYEMMMSISETDPFSYDVEEE